MCVIPVMPPQTAPLWVFPGVLPAVNPQIVNPSGFITPQTALIQRPLFQIPAIFAMSGESVTAETPEPVPSGNGVNGADGGNGNGGRGKDVIEAMKKDLPRTKTMGEAIGRIDSDIEGLGEVASRLGYIREVGLFLDALRKRFGFDDLVDILVHIAKRADELTGYLTARGLTEQVAVDIYSVIGPLFRLAVEYERMLLRNDELTLPLAAKIAFVHDVSGRKAEYFRVLKGAEGKPIVPIMPVLVLLDAAKRYEVLGLGNDAMRALGFLDELKYYHALPEDLRTWVIIRVERRITETIEALAGWQNEPDLFEEMWDPIRIAWNDLVRGIYLFSPHIYDLMVKRFNAHGMTRMAQTYDGLRKDDIRTAQRLGVYVE